MFKTLSHYQALIFSIAVHALLLFAFLHYSANHQHRISKEPQKTSETNKEAIKSYLYSPIVLPNKTAVTVENLAEKLPESSIKDSIKNYTQNNTESNTQNNTESRIEEKSEKVVPEIATNTNKSLSKTIDSENKTIANTSENIVKETPTMNYQHLDSLREKINQNIINQEIALAQQFRSPSEMHGEQAPVPHSKRMISPQEQKEANTTNYADGLSITKGDNGFCTVERDLTSIGIDGIKSLQAFSCGESAMAKSFREHMTKVKEKLGK